MKTKSGRMVDEVIANNSEVKEMSKDELLDEIANTGNYTDKETELRRELNRRKLQ